MKKDLTDSPGCGDGSGQMLEGLEVFCPERKRSENARAASRNLWTYPATEGPSSVKADLRRTGRSSMGGQGWLDTERIFYEKLPHNGDTIREKRPPNSYLSPVLSPWALSEADYPGVEPRTQ